MVKLMPLFYLDHLIGKRLVVDLRLYPNLYESVKWFDLKLAQPGRNERKPDGK